MEEEDEFSPWDNSKRKPKDFLKKKKDNAKNCLLPHHLELHTGGSQLIVDVDTYPVWCHRITCLSETNCTTNNTYVLGLRRVHRKKYSGPIEFEKACDVP